MSNQRTGQRGQRTVRQKVAAATVAIGVVLFGIAIAPGAASAHHPVLSGTTSCRTGDTWTVNWTATSANWKNYWTINTSGWSPGGWQPWNTAFTRSISYPAAQESATTTVSASWSNSLDGSNPVHDNETSGPVQRPPLCEVPTTTTTTTTTTSIPPPVVTPETSAPAVTTTTPGEALATTTTEAQPTTTVEQAVPPSVGQQGPTSSVDQSSGAASEPTTAGDAVGGALPATGPGDGSARLTVIAVTLIGIGAVMLRLTSRTR